MRRSPSPAAQYLTVTTSLGRRPDNGWLGGKMANVGSWFYAAVSDYNGPLSPSGSNSPSNNQRLNPAQFQ